MVVDITKQDNKSSFPFDLPSDDDSEVYSSVELNRVASQKGAIAPSGAHAAVAVSQLSLTLAGEAKLVPVLRTPFSIGGTEADLHVPGEFVDDWHAILQNHDGVISVEDVRSVNGVFLKIENELTLEDFDQIAIGNQRFVFRSSWDAPDEREETTAKIYGAHPPSGARLVQIFEGGVVGATWFIDSGLTITGTLPADRKATQYAVIKDSSISSPHASIIRVATGYVINDLQSSTGIFVRVSGSVELFDGDTFLIANTPISLRYP